MLLIFCTFELYKLEYNNSVECSYCPLSLTSHINKIYLNWFLSHNQWRISNSNVKKHITYSLTANYMAWGLCLLSHHLPLPPCPPSSLEEPSSLGWLLDGRVLGHNPRDYYWVCGCACRFLWVLFYLSPTLWLPSKPLSFVHSPQYHPWLKCKL